MHWFSDMETVGTGGRITMFFCFVLFFLEQFWSGTSLLCHEERVSSESYYVPLQPPPPFCFNFFNTWTNKRLALIMGNPLAEQQWIHSGAPSVCVYYAMHIVPVLLDWVFSVPKLHSLGKRYRSTPHVVCVKAWPWKHAHTQKWEGKCKWARKTEILFLPCNQWLCKHTHTHTRLLVIRSFPTLLWYKAPHQDGRMKRGRDGRKYRGMEGQSSAA